MRRFSFYRLSFIHGLAFAGLAVATILYAVGLIGP